MGAEEVPESWSLKSEEYFAKGKNVCVWMGGK